MRDNVSKTPRHKTKRDLSDISAFVNEGGKYSPGTVGDNDKKKSESRYAKNTAVRAREEKSMTIDSRTALSTPTDLVPRPQRIFPRL